MALPNFYFPATKRGNMISEIFFHLIPPPALPKKTGCPFSLSTPPLRFSPLRRSNSTFEGVCTALPLRIFNRRCKSDRRGEFWSVPQTGSFGRHLSTFLYSVNLIQWVAILLTIFYFFREDEGMSTLSTLAGFPKFNTQPARVPPVTDPQLVVLFFFSSLVFLCFSGCSQPSFSLFFFLLYRIRFPSCLYHR